MQRKTERCVRTSHLAAAAKPTVEGKLSIRQAALAHHVTKPTLRFLKCSAADRNAFGYCTCKSDNLVFTNEYEEMWASHVKDLDNRYHGITHSNKSYAASLRICPAIPKNYMDNKAAGKDWFAGFQERQIIM